MNAHRVIMVGGSSYAYKHTHVGRDRRSGKMIDPLIGHPCPSSAASTFWGRRQHLAAQRSTTYISIHLSIYGTGTHLGLLRLLLALLRLGLADRRLARLRADSRGLVALRDDRGEIGADDAALVLHGAAGALLGDLLRDTLLVHAPVDLRPGDLAGVLALEEERLILRSGKAEDLKSIACEDKLGRVG